MMRKNTVINLLYKAEFMDGESNWEHIQAAARGMQDIDAFLFSAC
jgi:hypothetical protein